MLQDTKSIIDDNSQDQTRRWSQAGTDCLSRITIQLLSLKCEGIAEFQLRKLDGV